MTPEAAIEPGPESDIVNLLCDDALPGYSINKDFLCNWQTELDHEAVEAVISNQVANEVLLLYPDSLSPYDSAAFDALQACIGRLDGLDNEIYFNFKVLMYETIHQATTSLKSFKFQLCRHGLLAFLVGNMVSFLDRNVLLTSERWEKIFRLKQEFLISFMEFGCDPVILKQLLAPIVFGPGCDKDGRLRETYLQILASAQNEFPEQPTFLIFDNFLKTHISLPFSSESPLLNCFTICSWFKLNAWSNNTSRLSDESICTSLFLFTSSHDSHDVVFKMQLIDFKKFVMVIHNGESNSRMSLSFNIALEPKHLENQGFTHMVLTYDLYQNLNLFIDGEYCESIPCPALSQYPSNWNKVYIGTLTEEHDPHSPFSKCELLLNDLFVLDLPLSFEWINFMYAMGVAYEWSRQDFSDSVIAEILIQMENKKFAMLELRVRDIIKDSKQSANHFLLNNLNSLRSTKTLNSTKSHSKSMVAKILSHKKLLKRDFVFDFLSSDFLKSIEINQSLHIYYNRTLPLSSSFYVLGGGGLLLVALENLMKDDSILTQAKSCLFLKLIDTFLTYLEGHPALAKEFQEGEGYYILSFMAIYYKNNFDSSLKFTVDDQNTSTLQGVEIPADLSLFSCFLDHFSIKNPRSEELLISNISGYKNLVMNFDIYDKTEDFSSLKAHLKGLFDNGQGQPKDTFLKMKMSSKVCQALRRKVLCENTKQALNSELDEVTGILVRADPSVDTIRCFAEFIILCLYHNEHDTSSQRTGLSVLQALVDKFCDSELTIKELRKFSRSMSVYWILLLLEFQSDSKQFAGQIVCAGLTLLAKLLKVLGVPIIRKFMRQSRGMDILTYFLKDWWNDERVFAVLLVSAFESDYQDINREQPNVYQILESEEFVKKSQKITLPETILLLNNLALVGGYVLAQKQGKVLSAPNSPASKVISVESYNSEILDTTFDFLHVINQLSSIVISENSRSLALQRVFFSKEWLESAFEIVAYVKLLRLYALADVKESFRATQEKFLLALTSIFVTRLPDFKLIISMLKSVNDITKKLIYESIFPKLFDHLMVFTLSSQFIFQEAEVLRGGSDLLEIYYDEYVQLNFLIPMTDLDLFLDCACGILERNDVSPKMKRVLGNIVGKSILVRLFKINDKQDHLSQVPGNFSDASAREALDEQVKYCLYKQAIFLQPEIISDETMHQVIVIIMGFYLKLSTESQGQILEHVLNFVRALVMMRNDTFDYIIDRLIDVSDYNNSRDLIKEFFENIVSKNDEDSIRYLQKHPTIKLIFNKSWQFRMRKLDDIGSIKMIDMVRVVLGNGGLFGNLSTSHIDKFKSNSSLVKATCISGELTKYGREELDKQEADIYATASFSSVKIEILRIFGISDLPNASYTLHYTESADRMRKLLILEDHLPESERLSYAVRVPVKPLEAHTENSLKGLNIGFPQKETNPLSILEHSLLDLDLEEYEEIDENGEAEGLGNSKTIHEDRNRKVLRSLYLGDHIQNLFNVSRIQGLDSIESLLILGHSHLYLIEHYFHCTDGNVIDVEEAPRELRDPFIQLIKPTVPSANGKAHRTWSWPLETLSNISRRKFLLRDIGLEMFFSDGASILITCLSSKLRDSIYLSLSSHTTGQSLDTDLAATLEVSSSPLLIIQDASSSGSFFSSRFASAFSSSSSVASKLQKLTRKWQEGKMSNFFYLMAINTMAGRTFNDLSQYPVFPWVLADYDSENLDLNDPRSFRDLSKPMGAQTETRAQEFRTRYEALKSFEDPSSPAFHYGTHYSSAMIVASYLIRMKPFVQSYLLLQGGSFDHADRLFNSVKKAWLSASKENTTDVRELTPEFFYLPEFLTNSNHFEFGKLQNGKSVNHVELPTWAHGDPKRFINMNREALESPYVSQNLHKWIDLIFGFKQNGKEAVDALNVFHHLSYEGAINLDNIDDEVEKRAVIGMINNFGQTPLKLFSKPHPPKEILNMANRYLIDSDASLRQLELSFESKWRIPIEKLEFSISKTNRWIGRNSCTSSEDQMLIRKPHTVGCRSQAGALIVNNMIHSNLHPAEILTILPIGNKQFLTASVDGVIKMWRIHLENGSKITLQHVLRGHLYPIRSLSFNKSFNVCLSLDSHGGLLLWDMARFKFVRKILSAEEKESQSKRLIAVSNDTGHFCIMSSNKFSNTLTVYTLNGDLLLEKCIEPGKVTSVAFAQFNTSLLDAPKSEFLHSFWSSEFLSVSFSSPNHIIRVYELKGTTTGFELTLTQKYDLSAMMLNSITTMMVMKETKTDEEEKISRGRFKFILGDSKGRVYTY
ncbi:hypothetical protein PUMCH_002427 [Australozyma saopauloensis]|uniref:Beige protein n=1 Tax=Australozyma saopauloensis TaxID=291208 RepID=A0AAX4H9I2_9ASCO|nr:hypothetical protein PUMCH_002427 [[Candida] saopauloensis]